MGRYDTFQVRVQPHRKAAGVSWPVVTGFWCDNTAKMGGSLAATGGGRYE